MAITRLARCAMSCEMVPSPAPRSAMTMRRHQLEERLGDSLPGAARHVLAAELAGQFVEVAAHLVLPLAQRQAQRGAVLRGFGDFGARPRAACPPARRAPSGGRRRSCRCGGRPPGRPVSTAPGGWKPGSAPCRGSPAARPRKALPARAAGAGAAGRDRRPGAAISGLTP